MKLLATALAWDSQPLNRLDQDLERFGFSIDVDTTAHGSFGRAERRAAASRQTATTREDWRAPELLRREGFTTRATKNTFNESPLNAGCFEVESAVSGRQGNCANPAVFERFISQHHHSWLNRGKRIALALLRFLWNDERGFLLALVLVDLFLARRTFLDGIWADNDSVCHYAYARHLVEDVYPATGTFLGYSPKFNVGVPFLLYNTPPGLYVFTAAVSSVLHVSTLAALKTCIVVGFISEPLLGFAIAKTFEDVPKDTPKFVALVLALFSGELYGLEFFFKNGMLNPAIGVPLLLATLYFFRRGQTAPFPSGLRHLALAALCFACTTCTHLLSAYMLCLALAAFVLGRRPTEWGHDVVRLGVVLTTGGLLASFWLVPSVPFAASQDAAYTWLRRPGDTIASFFDGSLLSSYFGGFFPRFITVSNVGIVAIVLGGLALVCGLRRRPPGLLSAFFVFLVGAVVTLGPFWSIGKVLLPGYDRLLWYRFLTLTELGWLLLAGIGAAYLAHAPPRFRPYNLIALAVGFVWAFVVLTGRAVKVEMSSQYPEFVADVDEIAGWLKEHGDKRGRVFDEFLSDPDVQSPSVNYTRHMMPILSGMNEIGGWVYENNLAGQVLMKKGVFWHSPFPILDQAPRYDVKYVVAGSSHFIRALTIDPRWKAVVTTRNLVLFENVAFEPNLADGRGLVGKLASERYLRGGGYEYVIDLAPAPEPSAEASLIVKVGYLPYFTVYADDVTVTTHPSKEGLLEVDLPPGASPHRLRCVWDIGALRAEGNRLSLAGLAAMLVLIGVSFVRWRPPSTVERTLSWIGLGAAVIGSAAVVVHNRKSDLSNVGFGVANGITPYAEFDTLKVGAFDDDRPNALMGVLPGAWDVRTIRGGQPARRLLRADQPAMVIALARRGSNTLTFHGAPEAASFTLSLEPPGRATACETMARMNAPVTLPPECLTGDVGGELPGVTRQVRIHSDVPLDITTMTADTGITIVEAESLRNVVDDGGGEAFYGLGPLKAPASNGVVMIGGSRQGETVDLSGRMPTRHGRFEVWILMRTLHARFLGTRAEVSLWLDDERVGGTRGPSRRSRDFWDLDQVFEWFRLGEAEVGDRPVVKLKIGDGYKGDADVDAMAFSPM